MVRASVLVVVVALLCAAAPAAAAAQRPRKAAFGISASLRFMRGAELRDTVDRLRDAGVRYSREDLKWNEVEPTPGRYDWSTWDRLVRASARGGVRILALPDGSPAWATGQTGLPPASGDALERFAAFVRAAVERYGTRGTFWDDNRGVPKVPITMWDIWNEPYYPTGWDGTVDPIAYATLFRRVVAVARDADPSARFMLEADTGSATGDWPEPPFLGAMLDAFPDLVDDVDVVSVHPYTSEVTPKRCTPDEDKPGFREAWLATRFQFCRVRDVRRILDAYGARDARLWITELGWTTAPDYPRSISEAGQARYIADSFRLLRRWRVVDGVVLFNLTAAENDPADHYDWFGLLHPDGTPKPGWNAFVDAIRDGLTAAPAR